MNVRFYTRDGCELCDEAESMLKLIQEDYPLTYERIDIDQDDAAHETYMLMIPVIEKDGDVLLYGKIGYVDIIDVLEETEN